jgi:hypothetical protein
MPTYSYQRPVRVTADGTDVKYRNDHLNHFFQNNIYHNILSLSDSEKERYFKLQRDYEWLFKKIYGNLNESMSNVTYLPTALKNKVDDTLIHQYKEWLDKQNA